MIRTVNYTLIRGLPWERVLIVKDRRTHHVQHPTDSRSYVKTGATSVMEIGTTLTTDNGIKLYLTAEETQDLPLGELTYDVLATVNGIQQPVSQGTISVSALNNITPLEDSQEMEIRFKQHVDFRRTFTWKDANGEILTIQSAFMQAKNSSGTTVIDLRWFEPAPDETAMIALPANRRGYLAPIEGATLELHISDKNTVAAGSYRFDLFVQDEAGDWDCLASGSVIVEEAISGPPT